ncbi:hypothetical protein CA833_21205 [Novosphingobium sp. KA1]|nr:hypothetical protein CA833_21205 [Novosphingobium sp. KA1]
MLTKVIISDERVASVKRILFEGLGIFCEVRVRARAAYVEAELLSGDLTAKLPEFCTSWQHRVKSEFSSARATMSGQEKSRPHRAG